ncbi:MAG: NAD(P)/FAD-dependent oxidoreductase [Desulfobacteraceae bacterium]|jgi:nitrite reductase (NADH) large subunit|nr:MAG: NAD(P)/FAD-dependent oxidoreductase [Desulfobacteraceae bacterium]
MADYVIVGNGAAGTTAAEHIRKRDKQVRISIISDEEIPFYWRIRLNEYLAGDIGEKELLAKKAEWYEDNKIDLRLGVRVEGVGSDGSGLVTSGGERISFDKLLVATGSRSFVPPIKGADKNGVFTLRSFRDVKEISAWAGNIQEVVIIGGGLLGLEAGHALRKLGLSVAVVEFFPRLLPRQLDVEGASRLQDIMEKKGFFFRLGAKTSHITGEDSAQGVVLEGGELIQARMVIISAGVRPDLRLAKALGLDTDKGLKVDETMRTSRDNIFAAGDVVEFKGVTYGIWPAALDQGRIAGINMTGGSEYYKGTTMANTLKVAGIDLASAGDIDADGGSESVLRVDEGVYKKIVFEENRIVGCIMLGDTKGFSSITKLMADKKDVSQVKDSILKEGFDFRKLSNF